MLALDAALPGGGLPAGSLVEIFDINDIPSGAETLACRFAASAAGETGFAAWIDTTELYPPAAAALGIDPSRFLVIHVHNSAEALWAFEQTLRSKAIAASIVTLARVPQSAARRLQLSAEAGGGIGLLLRPDREALQPSPASVRLRAAAVEDADTSHLPWGRRIEISILKARGGYATTTVSVVI